MSVDKIIRIWVSHNSRQSLNVIRKDCLSEFIAQHSEFFLITYTSAIILTFFYFLCWFKNSVQRHLHSCIHIRKRGLLREWCETTAARGKNKIEKAFEHRKEGQDDQRGQSGRRSKCWHICLSVLVIGHGEVEGGNLEHTPVIPTQQKFNQIC